MKTSWKKDGEKSLLERCRREAAEIFAANHRDTNCNNTFRANSDTKTVTNRFELDLTLWLAMEKIGELREMLLETETAAA